MLADPRSDHPQPAGKALAIGQQPPAAVVAIGIDQAALDRGMVALREEGARKVMLGMTTPEEVLLMTSEESR